MRRQQRDQEETREQDQQPRGAAQGLGNPVSGPLDTPKGGPRALKPFSGVWLRTKSRPFFPPDSEKIKVKLSFPFPETAQQREGDQA